MKALIDKGGYVLRKWDTKLKTLAANFGWAQWI
jgi:hypothetical protein